MGAEHRVLFIDVCSLGWLCELADLNLAIECCRCWGSDIVSFWGAMVLRAVETCMLWSAQSLFGIGAPSQPLVSTFQPVCLCQVPLGQSLISHREDPTDP